MDYKKQNNSVFNGEDAAKEQIASAFSSQPEAPRPMTLSDNFTLPSTRQYQRKVQATYTVRPEIKASIEELAAKQGYRSSSAFIDEVLEQILKQTK
ncbi:hypothetical protein LNP18_06110 [Leuconostoc citreum]|uniref:hypothetical protein n=1 Tax=Leuconostoc citreum TaxID=33964 RepID=UPI00200AF40C|nr:hypothetical protein [Leuconostoc citreum]MCK8605676.1 hypothetical protein [Leuconostoc citreum]